MTVDVESVQWLGTAEAEAALSSLASESISVALVEKLRTQFGASRASALLTVATARSKAIEKWGVGDWLVTDRAIQQATDRWIADYKAERIASDVEIFDWCCGVGGEAMRLAMRAPLIAVDHDQVIAAMARHNVGIANPKLSGSNSWQVLCADVFDQVPSPTAWLNIDPDRRPDGTRKTKANLLEPALDRWWPYAISAIGASVKLAPATQVPTDCSDATEREWISRVGTCRQQVLWLGDDFQSGSIRATAVGNDGSATSFATTEISDCARVSTCGAYIYDLDPAVRAAGLSTTYANRFELQCLGDPTGFYTADENQVDSLAQSFLVHWQGPADMKLIRQALTALDATVVDVKTRGIPWHPPKVIKKLCREAGTELTLLASRNPSYSGAVLASRVKHQVHRL